jgi:hypothetical protein
MSVFLRFLKGILSWCHLAETSSNFLESSSHLVVMTRLQKCTLKYCMRIGHLAFLRISSKRLFQLKHLKKKLKRVIFTDAVNLNIAAILVFIAFTSAPSKISCYQKKFFRAP